MIYILSIICTLLWVVYQKWQFIDDKGGVSGKWHLWGALLRASLFLFGYLLQKYPSTWKDYLLSGAICIVLFEVGINIIALNQKWNYVGFTSEFDKKLSIYKWVIMGVFLVTALIIKIFIK